MQDIKYNNKKKKEDFYRSVYNLDCLIINTYEIYYIKYI